MGDKMNRLELIKESLERNVGNEIFIKFNKGRRQKCIAKGILEKTYQSIFVVRIKQNINEKVLSFTYADVFTKNIEVMFSETKKVSNQ